MKSKNKLRLCLSLIITQLCCGDSPVAECTSIVRCAADAMEIAKSLMPALLKWSERASTIKLLSERVDSLMSLTPNVETKVGLSGFYSELISEIRETLTNAIPKLPDNCKEAIIEITKRLNARTEKTISLDEVAAMQIIANPRIMSDRVAEAFTKLIISKGNPEEYSARILLKAELEAREEFSKLAKECRNMVLKADFAARAIDLAFDTQTMVSVELLEEAVDALLSITPSAQLSDLFRKLVSEIKPKVPNLDLKFTELKQEFYRLIDMIMAMPEELESSAEFKSLKSQAIPEELLDQYAQSRDNWIKSIELLRCQVGAIDDDEAMTQLNEDNDETMPELSNAKRKADVIDDDESMPQLKKLKADSIDDEAMTQLNDVNEKFIALRTAIVNMLNCRNLINLAEKNFGIMRTEPFWKIITKLSVMKSELSGLTKDIAKVLRELGIKGAVARINKSINQKLLTIPATDLEFGPKDMQNINRAIQIIPHQSIMPTQMEEALTDLLISGSVAAASLQALLETRNDIFKELEKTSATALIPTEADVALRELITAGPNADIRLCQTLANKAFPGMDVTYGRGFSDTEVS